MDMFGIIAVVIVLAVVGIEYFKPGTILKKKNQKKTVRKSPQPVKKYSLYGEEI